MQPRPGWEAGRRWLEGQRDNEAPQFMAPPHPNGDSLVIDHFQLRADLRVNADRFHQVGATFRHQRNK